MTELHEQFRLLGERWAEQDGVARGLEEMRKSILSELVNQSAHSAISRAEHDAQASQRYKAHVRQMIQERTAANVLKAQLNALQMQFELWRSGNAMKRAEMRL